jgi:hypothetical protein
MHAAKSYHVFVYTIGVLLYAVLSHGMHAAKCYHAIVSMLLLYIVL